MGLIGIFGYLGYLHIQKSDSNPSIIVNEIAKNSNKIKQMQIIGFVLDIIDYLLIFSEKAAPELLYDYYLEHKVLVKIVYFFGGLVLLGIFSAIIYFKLNERDNNSQFDEVELR